MGKQLKTTLCFSLNVIKINYKIIISKKSIFFCLQKQQTKNNASLLQHCLVRVQRMFRRFFIKTSINWEHIRSIFKIGKWQMTTILRNNRMKTLFFTILLNFVVSFMSAYEISSPLLHLRISSAFSFLACNFHTQWQNLNNYSNFAVY